jgi:hypothetical protein
VNEGRLQAGVAELRRGLLGRFRVDVGDDRRHAFGGETLRDRETDAHGGAGDEGDSFV